MNRSMPGLPVHHQLPEFTQTHILWVGDAIQPSHPLSSPSPPAPNPSQHQSLFQWVTSLHEVAMSMSFSIISSKEIPGLISFRMDWLDLLAVQGTLKSLLQHHSAKASLLGGNTFLGPGVCWVDCKSVSFHFTDTDNYQDHMQPWKQRLADESQAPKLSGLQKLTLVHECECTHRHKHLWPSWGHKI